MTARRWLLVQERVEDLGSAGGLPSGPILSGLSLTVVYTIQDFTGTELLRMDGREPGYSSVFILSQQSQLILS